VVVLVSVWLSVVVKLELCDEVVLVEVEVEVEVVVYIV